MKHGDAALEQEDPEVLRHICIPLLASFALIISLLCVLQTNGTPLMFASSHGRGDAVHEMVKLGADVNKTNKHGATALHMAALKGSVGIIAELIERGANVHALNEHGQNALHFASLRGTSRNGHSDETKVCDCVRSHRFDWRVSRRGLESRRDRSSGEPQATNNALPRHCFQIRNCLPDKKLSSR